MISSKFEIVEVEVQNLYVNVDKITEFWTTLLLHDDVTKWKHFLHYWPFVWGIHWSPVNSPHKGQWRGALMFSQICAWINGNNHEAGDLRRYCAHYDVIVMYVQELNWRVSLSELTIHIIIRRFIQLCEASLGPSVCWNPEGSSREASWLLALWIMIYDGLVLYQQEREDTSISWILASGGLLIFVAWWWHIGLKNWVIFHCGLRFDLSII